jgi:hypothetical protein
VRIPLLQMGSRQAQISTAVLGMLGALIALSMEIYLCLFLLQMGSRQGPDLNSCSRLVGGTGITWHEDLFVLIPLLQMGSRQGPDLNSCSRHVGGAYCT